MKIIIKHTLWNQNHIRNKRIRSESAENIQGHRADLRKFQLNKDIQVVRDNKYIKWLKRKNIKLHNVSLKMNQKIFRRKIIQIYNRRKYF